MTAIHNYSRYDVLLSQFPKKNQIRRKELDSFTRLFDFLYEHTNIHYLAFIKEDTLVKYLKYHCTNHFKTITFIEAMQDIKLFIFYIKNTQDINKELHIDFSLENVQL